MPVLLAIFEVIRFGISLNSGVLKSISQPSMTCLNESIDPEGKNYRFESKITINPPMTGSIPHSLQIQTNEGYSIFKEISVTSINPMAIVYNYGSPQSVVKTALFRNKFITSDKMDVNFVLVAPIPVGRNECVVAVSMIY